jgi:hypothetical protein
MVLMISALQVALAGCQSVPELPETAGHVATAQLGAAPQGYTMTYQSIGGSGGLSRPTNLCELLESYNAGAGLYRVVSLVGRTEPSASQPSVPDGFTYVTLELVEDWSGGAPQKPVARISGGPLDAQRTKGWRVSLAVNEVVGVLLDAPTPQNAGYYDLHSLAVFKQQETGGHTNGQLFRHARAGELGKKVRRLAPLVGKGCEAEDVAPEDDEVATPAPAPGTGQHAVVTKRLDAVVDDPE